MLFGRVTDFGVRTNLRASGPMPRIQNPFLIPGFEELDRLVSMVFITSLPPRFKNSFSELESMYGGGGLDTDLYMVHLVPHAYVTSIRFLRPTPSPVFLSSATITLHNPYVDFSDPQSVSTSRCVEASRAILAQHYTLASSSFDITRLHPFVTVRTFLRGFKKALSRLSRFVGTWLLSSKFNFASISSKLATLIENTVCGV